MSFDSNTPRIPKRRPDCDVFSLPLSPEEAFLLSRIDDQVNEVELAILAGLDVSLVRPALHRLEELGAIRLETVTRRPPAGEINAVVAEAFAELRPRALDLSHLEAEGAALVAPTEVEELCDLDAQEKQSILDLYRRLDDLDHYALLRIPRNADKRAVKRAYYELAPNFHPDRYFRKDLGSFKHKMEAIFGRLTLAHDTLTRNSERAAYDAYLASVPQPLQQIASAPPPRIETPPPRPSQAPPRTDAPSAPPPSGPALSPEEERLRRAALARKLLGRSSPSQPPSSSSSSQMARVSAESALETLHHRRVAMQEGTQRTLLKRYVEAATAAQSRGDLAAAANFYRLAREYAPDDLEIAAAQEQMAKAATVALAQGHFEQGEREAKQERWQDAAISYSKAANGLPKSLEAQLKAAIALLKSQGDVRKAVDYARRAVALEPKSIDARHALAESYIAAGLQPLAKKELSAMQEIAPKDARLASLAKRLK